MGGRPRGGWSGGMPVLLRTPAISARDSSDPATEADVQAAVDRTVQRMASALLVRELDNPQYVVQYDAGDC